MPMLRELATNRKPFDLLVRGDLVLPGRVLRGGALGVRDGRIAGVLEPGVAVEATEVRGFGGRYAPPGLAATDLPVVLHAELQEIVDRLLAHGLAAGREGDPRAHGRSRPVVSETGAIVKALELACWSGARIHVAHVTHPHGFRLLEYYRGL